MKTNVTTPRSDYVAGNLYLATNVKDISTYFNVLLMPKNHPVTKQYVSTLINEGRVERIDHSNSNWH